MHFFTSLIFNFFLRAFTHFFRPWRALNLHLKLLQNSKLRWTENPTVFFPTSKLKSRQFFGSGWKPTNLTSVFTLQTSVYRHLMVLRQRLMWISVRMLADVRQVDFHPPVFLFSFFAKRGRMQSLFKILVVVKQLIKTILFQCPDLSPIALYGLANPRTCDMSSGSSNLDDW